MGRVKSFFAIIPLVVSFVLSGCGPETLNEEELFLLSGIFEDISSLKEEYPGELARFNEDHIEKGANFLSYSYDKTESGAIVLLNPNYFWVKVSLSRNPVEAMDSHPPAFTLRIPRFGKYLKLRTVGQNLSLQTKLVKIVYAKGLEFGGVEPRGPASRQGRRGFFGP